MSHLLQDQAVIITGAGQGLGHAYALDAALAGAAVIVNDINPAAAAATVTEIVDAGGSAIACPGSVSSPGFGDLIVEQALTTFGRLDGFVANAGVLNAASLFDETTENARKTVETNLMGVIEVGLASAKAMRQSGSGSIVLITSASRFGLLDSTTYGATKGAIASLCWGWALEGEPYGIRVNAVSPLAATPMMMGNGVQTTMQPESVAPAVVYLLSDLSVRITGQIIRVYDTGLALYPEPRTLSAELLGEGWSPETIARAMETELAVGISAVGRIGELTVALQ
ncbi:MAG: short-chain dehydrogenase/reductase [Microbacteriaceae bacterium]|nr:short-chain dehydrogenase/reductase [Microbacteriaceae bacterium]